MEQIGDVLKSLHPFHCLLHLVLPFVYFIFKSSRNLPPGPFPWPIVGNILSLGNNPHVSLAELASSHGPLISLRLGTKLLVVGSSPDAAREILKTQDRVMSARCVPHAVPVYPNRLDLSMGWSDCTDQWKYLRTIVKTELFSPKTIGAQAYIRELKVSQMLDVLRTKEGAIVNIGEFVFTVVYNMLSTIFISKDFLSLYKDNTMALKDVRKFMEVLVAPNLADYYALLSRMDLQGLNKKSNEIFVKVTGLWEGTLKERTENKEGDIARPKDFLDCLLERGLTKAQIDYLFLDLLFAGVDTTTSTVEWALAELIKNPKAMEKVIAELQREVKEDVVKESDLQSLPYLHSVIKESLRLHPPAPLLLPHRALETCKVMNYTIPKDTQVFVNVWAIGRDPKNWEDPLTFKPERFLETSLEQNTSDFTFLAFGSGRRICPGLPMATKQAPLILSGLLKCIRWSLPHDVLPTTLDMDENFGITLQKKKPLLLIPKFQKSIA